MLLLEMFVQVFHPFEAFLTQITCVRSLLRVSTLMAHKLVLIGAHLSTRTTRQVLHARPSLTGGSTIILWWTWRINRTKWMIGAHYAIRSSIRARVVLTSGEGDRLRRPFCKVSARPRTALWFLHSVQVAIRLTGELQVTGWTVGVT